MSDHGPMMSSVSVMSTLIPGQKQDSAPGQQDPDDGRPAGSEPVVELPGERHEHHHHQGLRQQHQAACQGVVDPSVLQERRDVTPPAGRLVLCRRPW